MSRRFAELDIAQLELEALSGGVGLVAFGMGPS